MLLLLSCLIHGGGKELGKSLVCTTPNFLIIVIKCSAAPGKLPERADYLAISNLHDHIMALISASEIRLSILPPRELSLFIVVLMVLVVILLFPLDAIITRMYYTSPLDS